MKTRIFSLVICLFIFTLSHAQHGWTLYNTSNSEIASNNAYAIVIDTSNTKWVATNDNNIINIFNDSTWTHLENYQISGAHGGNMIIDKDGNKWIIGDGISKWNGTYWRNYNTCNSNIPDMLIYDIATDSLNNKWIATKYNGIAMFNERTFTTYSYYNTILPDDNIYCLTFDKKGNLWAGTANNGLYKNENGVWTNFNVTNSGIPGNNVYSTTVDSQGKIWCGTYNGVGVYDGTNWTIYNTSNSGIAGNYIRSFAFVDSIVWIGTGNNGVSQFNGEKWVTYNTSNSPLPNNRVNSMAYEKDKNKLWLATLGGGVVALNLDSVKIPVDTTSINSSKNITSISLSQNNIIPVNVFPNPSAGVIHINSFNVGFKPNLINIYDITGKLVFSKKLSLSKQEITFPFATNGSYLVEVKSDDKKYVTNMTFKK